MKIDTDDLVSVRQIAARLNVRSQAVSNWQQRCPTFPKPAWSDGRAAAFLWWQVEAWAKHTGRI